MTSLREKLQKHQIRQFIDQLTEKHKLDSVQCHFRSDCPPPGLPLPRLSHDELEALKGVMRQGCLQEAIAVLCAVVGINSTKQISALQRLLSMIAERDQGRTNAT
jgi:hypothetical protein